MADPQFRSFEEFWPYYLGEHSDRTNRTMHVAGTAAALATLGAAVARRDWKLAALAPLLGYGPAWIGHFVIERNRPATFKHPLWSLRGDLKMAAMTLAGRLDDELARLAIHEDVIDM